MQQINEKAKELLLGNFLKEELINEISDIVEKNKNDLILIKNGIIAYLSLYEKQMDFSYEFDINDHTFGVKIRQKGKETFEIHFNLG